MYVCMNERGDLCVRIKNVTSYEKKIVSASKYICLYVVYIFCQKKAIFYNSVMDALRQKPTMKNVKGQPPRNYK